jgi:hypothetical protein
MTESSELRATFGTTKAPIQADKAFKKPLQHFQDMGVDGIAWILLDTDAGIRISANIYNGKAGKNFQPKTFDIPEDIGPLTKNYDEVDPAECPITVAGAAKVAAEAATTEAATTEAAADPEPEPDADASEVEEDTDAEA